MAMSIDWESIRTAADDTEERRQWRALYDLHRRLTALEAAAPKPERAVGWYAVQTDSRRSPLCLWWDGWEWRFSDAPDDGSHHHALHWIGPRIDLPAEKV